MTARNISGFNEVSVDASGVTLTGGMSFNLSSTASLSLVNGASLNSTFVSNGGGAGALTITLDGGSTLTLGGNGNPLNNAVVDLLDFDSLLQFSAETIDSFLFFASPSGEQGEHFGKITFQGDDLIFGSDPFAFEAGDNALATEFNGGSGVQIQAIPEPAITLLGGLGLLALVRRRRV